MKVWIITNESNDPVDPELGGTYSLVCVAETKAAALRFFEQEYWGHSIKWTKEGDEFYGGIDGEREFVLATEEVRS
jgi:hypothetical protein